MTQTVSKVTEFWSSCSSISSSVCTHTSRLTMHSLHPVSVCRQKRCWSLLTPSSLTWRTPARYSNYYSRYRCRKDLVRYKSEENKRGFQAVTERNSWFFVTLLCVYHKMQQTTYELREMQRMQPKASSVEIFQLGTVPGTTEHIYLLLPSIKSTFHIKTSWTHY